MLIENFYAGKSFSGKPPKGLQFPDGKNIDVSKIKSSRLSTDVNPPDISNAQKSNFKNANPDTPDSAQDSLADGLGVPRNPDGSLNLSSQIGNQIEVDGKMKEISTSNLEGDSVNLDDMSVDDLKNWSADSKNMIGNINKVKKNLDDLKKQKIGSDGKISPELDKAIRDLEIELDTKKFNLINFNQKVKQKMNAPGKTDTDTSFSYKGADGEMKNVEIVGGELKVNGTKINTPDLKAAEANNIAQSLEIPKNKSPAEAKAEFKAQRDMAIDLKRKGLDFEIDSNGRVTIKNKNLDPNAKKMQSDMDAMKKKNKWGYKKLAAIVGVGLGALALANFVDCKIKKKKNQDAWFPTTVDRLTCNTILDYAIAEDNFVPETSEKGMPPSRYDFVGRTIRGTKMLEYSMRGIDGYDDWQLSKTVSPTFQNEHEVNGKLPYELEESSNNSCVLAWKTEVGKTEDCTLENAIGRSWSQIGSVGKAVTKGAIKTIGDVAATGLGATFGAVGDVLGSALDSMGLGWIKDNWQTIGMVISGIVLLIVAFKVYKMFKGSGGDE